MQRATPLAAAVPVIQHGTVTFEPLTGLAAEIANAIGMEAAVALLAKHGGLELGIPVKPGESELARTIGVEAAARMIAAFGYGRLVLPCAHLRGAAGRRARAARMLMAGASVRDVVLACDVSTRTVRSYRAALRTADLLPPDDAATSASEEDPA